MATRDEWLRLAEVAKKLADGVEMQGRHMSAGGWGDVGGPGGLYLSWEYREKPKIPVIPWKYREKPKMPVIHCGLEFYNDDNELKEGDYIELTPEVRAACKAAGLIDD